MQRRPKPQCDWTTCSPWVELRPDELERYGVAEAWGRRVDRAAFRTYLDEGGRVVVRWHLHFEKPPEQPK